MLAGRFGTISNNFEEQHLNLNQSPNATKTTKRGTMKKHELDFDSFFIANLDCLFNCLQRWRGVIDVIGKRFCWFHRRPTHPKLSVTTNDRYDRTLGVVRVGQRTTKKRLPPYPDVHMILGPGIVLDFRVFIDILKETGNVIHFAILPQNHRNIAKQN